MKIAFQACSARYEWFFTNIFLLLLHQRPNYLYLPTISRAFSLSVKENECLAYIWLCITIFVLAMLIIRFQISQYLYKIIHFVPVGSPQILKRGLCHLKKETRKV